MVNLLSCPNPQFLISNQKPIAAIDVARNIIASDFYRSKEFDTLLFLDDDIVFDAKDMVKLCNHIEDGKNVVGAAYATKNIKPSIAARFFDNQTVSFSKDSKPVKIKYLPGGCLMIAKKVFGKLAEKLPLCNFSEPISFWPFFQPMIKHTRSGLFKSHNDYLTEDYSFPVSPDVKVIDAQLNWKGITEFKIGDKILGADEKSLNIYGDRKFRESEVTGFFEKKLELWRIVTTGREIITTQDHKWFMKRMWRSDNNSKNEIPKHWSWQQTGSIKSGDFVSCPMEVFKEVDIYNFDYMIGYMRGAWDGDGTVFSKGYNHYVRLSQTDFESVERIEEYLKRLRIVYHRSIRHLKNINWKPLNNIEVCRNGHFENFINLVYGQEIESKEYKKGYLAGIFDAEGCFGKKDELSIANFNKDIIQKCVGYLAYLGFEFKYRSFGIVNCKRLEILRFISMVNPAIKRKKNFSNRGFVNSEENVLSVESLHKRGDVVCLTTSTGTFFADGFFSHNCERATDSGFDIWLDPSIRLSHVGQKLYTLENVFDKPVEPMENITITQSSSKNGGSPIGEQLLSAPEKVS